MHGGLALYVFFRHNIISVFVDSGFPSLLLQFSLTDFDSLWTIRGYFFLLLDCVQPIKPNKCLLVGKKENGSNKHCEGSCELLSLNLILMLKASSLFKYHKISFCTTVHKTTSVYITSLPYKCTQNQITVQVYTKPVYCTSVTGQ